MILSDRNFMNGVIGSVTGLAPSFRNVIVQGVSSEYGVQRGSVSPFRSLPLGSPLRMKLHQ